MRNRIRVYWGCQLGGWLCYGLAMFIAGIFLGKAGMVLPRLLLTMLLGISFTHLLRQLIVQLKLRPPLAARRWLLLGLIVLLVTALFCLVNSVLAEWLRFKGLPLRVSFEKSFASNLVLHSFLIFIWFSIYYIWHYVELASFSEMREATLQSRLHELEANTIRSQINPQSVFAALDSIRKQVGENPGKARIAITELSKTLRNAIRRAFQPNRP